jgi:hypothetical protein
MIQQQLIISVLFLLLRHFQLRLSNSNKK